ncbi:site-specific integrase [Gordonibacter sp. An230]|uniref:site-specific integrase n=1 Tax=Gordonibacter sp. An230 TaxID=1965592 RepID=UPI00406C8C1D
MDWQNKMVGSYDDEGKPYSGTYLRTINNQLSAIFNHAVKYYGLGKSPAAPTIKIGERQGSEMKFWTKEQYLMFSEEVMDKPASFYVFEILCWCGLRVGELLALEPEDIDLRKCLIHATKSYQRIKRRDVITSPKTPKSRRDVVMPEFLADELADFLESIPKERRERRIFGFTKNYLHHEMKRGCAACGLGPIRIHDLRHSHVSPLVEMGFGAIAIADRLGRETYEMTLRYAHLFPSKQSDMAEALDRGRRL